MQNKNGAWSSVFSCGARDTACRRFIPSYSDMWVASGLLCWYLMLPSLMRVGFGVFQCRSIGRPEDKYLTIDMEEPCWQGRHAHFALLVGMPMLVLHAVTAPLGIIFRLSKAKKMRLAHPSILLRYNLIYSGYRSSKYWFELVVLVRKYLIIVASTFFVSDISQLQIVLGVMIIALSMHSTNDPFGRFLPDELLLHRFEITSLLVLTFVVWCRLYFSTMNYSCETSQAGWCTLLVLLIMIMNILYVILVTRSFCCEWSKRMP